MLGRFFAKVIPTNPARGSPNRYSYRGKEVVRKKNVFFMNIRMVAYLCIHREEEIFFGKKEKRRVARLRISNYVHREA